MTKVLKQRLLVRVLCLLLSLFLLVMPILTPMAQAVFVESAAVAYAYELLAAALVAGGFVAANSDDLISVSAAVYKWAKDKADPLCDTLLGIARQALSFAGDITTTAWRMSTQAWDAICDAISGIYSSGSTVLPVTFTATVQQYMQNSKLEETFHPGIPGTKTLSTAITITDGKNLNWLFTCELIGSYWVVYRNGTKIYDFESQGGISGFYMTWISEKYYQIVFNTSKPDLSYSTGGGVAYSLDKYDTYDVIVHNLISTSAVPAPTLTYPGTMTKAPPLPTTTADPDTGKEIVVVPPISVKPGDWTADIPTTDTGDLVDVPTDTLVDATTGEIVGEGDIPDVNPPGTLPKPGDLTIPQLIITKFPFSIPFDLYNMLMVLDAEPVEPVFKIPFNVPKVVSYEFVLDFSRFESIIEIIRWGEYIVFLVGLAHATRNVIKW